MALKALISVSNKFGVIDLARELSENFGFEIISSGGTAKELENNNIPVIKVSKYTGSEEILNGRVKTLHPKIHGGILADRDQPSHLRELKDHNIDQIDLVVVNLYPFKKAIEKPNCSFEEAIENIDIGGPTLIRAAAKNHKNVSVLTDPNQYKQYLIALKNKELTLELRTKFAIKAFEHTAAYDVMINNWIDNKFNEKTRWDTSLQKISELRYGENPHQNAKWFGSTSKGWGAANKLQGKELSTNNLLDLESALSTIIEFGYDSDVNKIEERTTAVVVKHTNPCGLASGESAHEAICKAIEADNISAFGGIVAVNQIIDEKAASQLTSLFLECVVAPGFSNEAKSILSQKKNLRLLELNPKDIYRRNIKNIRSINGGLLVQDQDNIVVDTSTWTNVTDIKPNKEILKDLIFGWKLVRHLRSNAIAVVSDEQSKGIGAGQMNRIGSAKIALEASKNKGINLILASDGFFPFDDTVRLAGQYGIKAIIQPGGSIKDKDSIKACNELGISMVFTNIRHFLH